MYTCEVRTVYYHACVRTSDFLNDKGLHIIMYHEGCNFLCLDKHDARPRPTLSLHNLRNKK